MTPHLQGGGLEDLLLGIQRCIPRGETGAIGRVARNCTVARWSGVGVARLHDEAVYRDTECFGSDLRLRRLAPLTLPPDTDVECRAAIGVHTHERRHGVLVLRATRVDTGRHAHSASLGTVDSRGLPPAGPLLVPPECFCTTDQAVAQRLAVELAKLGPSVRQGREVHLVECLPFHGSQRIAGADVVLESELQRIHVDLDCGHIE